MDWFKEAFGSFSDISPAALVIALIALAIGIGGVIYGLKRRGGKIKPAQWTTKELTSAALCISAAFLLSFIKLFSLPNGGSITPASTLPIMVYAYVYGVRRGAVAGLLFGLLQFIQQPIFLSFSQFLLDYVAAFTLLCLCGFAKKSIVPGVIYGCAGMFVSQFFSGVAFFGEYAPAGMPVWLYSLAYNGSRCAIECAICIGVCVVPAIGSALKRAKNNVEIQREKLAQA